MKIYKYPAKFLRFFFKNIFYLIDNFYYSSFIFTIPSASSKNKTFFENKLLLTQKFTSKDITDYENKSSKKIDRNWLYELALSTQIINISNVKSIDHGKLLYSSISNWIKKNEIDNIRIFETGSARGFSSLCMAKALRDNKKKGTIITLDVLPHEEKMYWNCISDSRGKTTRKNLLKKWEDLINEYIIYIQSDTIKAIKRISLGRIHIAFLDAAHTYKNVLKESIYVSKYQKTGDLIIYDDFNKNKFPGLVKAVEFFSNNFNYKFQVLKGMDNRNYVISEKA